ncbi:MAG: hypothetical protein Kow006_20350 [Gammaproteobacteria bacterium]
MKKSLVLAGAAVALFTTGIAQAVVCAVNIEKAYQEAVKEGWKFGCYGGIDVKPALAFDSQKRVGCSGRSPSVSIKPRVTAYYFRNDSVQDGSKRGKLRGGWKIYSYKVNGGQYTKKKANLRSRLVFQFTPPSTPNAYFKRHLSELKLSKDGGSCSQVYEEAF